MSDKSGYSVNCSLLFTDKPLLQRPRLAKAAGFEAVEFWWPFTGSSPLSSEVDGFVDALDDAGVRLTGLNFNAGDMAAGDRGLVSLPTHAEEFRANLDVVTMIGERTGCRQFNALYGNRLAGAEASKQDDLAAENLRLAAAAVGRIGGTVLVEAVSGADAYPIKTAADVVEVLDRVDRPNIGLLFDVYHLATNGVDVSADLARYRDRISHVQIADAPGRGAPGTGDLPIMEWIADLREGGYDGLIALEYKADSDGAFAWLDGR